MGPVQFGLKFEKWMYTVSKSLNWVSIVFVVIMLLTVVIDVGGSSLLKKPLTGSIDIIELMMVLVVFLGLGYCAAVEGNVRVDVVHGRLPKRVQAGLDIFTFAASAFIIALITWRLATRAWGIVLEPPGPSTATFLIPHLPFIWVATVGSLLLFLELLIYLFRSIARVR